MSSSLGPSTSPILSSKFNLTPTFFKMSFLTFSVLGDDPLTSTPVQRVSFGTQFLIDLITFGVSLIFQITPWSEVRISHYSIPNTMKLCQLMFVVLIEMIMPQSLWSSCLVLFCIKKESNIGWIFVSSPNVYVET